MRWPAATKARCFMAGAASRTGRGVRWSTGCDALGGGPGRRTGCCGNGGRLAVDRGTAAAGNPARGGVGRTWTVVWRTVRGWATGPANRGCTGWLPEGFGRYTGGVEIRRASARNGAATFFGRFCIADAHLQLRDLQPNSTAGRFDLRRRHLGDAAGQSHRG